MIPHLKAVWQFRYFWTSLVQLDLRNRYRRSVLGIGWSLLHPLALTVVITVAFGGLLGTDNWRTFAPYVLAGLAVWDFMKGSTIMCCDAFYRGEAYIRQCPLPLSIYTLRTVLGTFIHFMISIGLCVVGLMILEQSTAVLSRLPALVPAIVILLIFSWSVGTIAAFANAYFHDTKHLIEVVSQLLFFLTPIMFSPKLLTDRVGSWVIEFNPVAHFLVMITDPLINNVAVPMEHYLSALALAAVAFGLACATVSWLQKRLIFQL